MCPPGYHHNGVMATPELRAQDARLHIVGEDCIVESPDRVIFNIYYLHFFTDLFLKGFLLTHQNKLHYLMETQVVEIFT